ncbi:uncharacterized protein CXorf66 homolog [Mus pahari]|uniref:uncharacterized protein CXorf66 homolog n=1 Tax=Mus pahari TaxID=10093 RepID=UPI000A30AB52|nr:uncharacterized protein CXorf66 homolog [Mus pahari]
MITAFIFTCFCLLHYNCMIEEVQTPGGLNKENMEAISSWVSKVSACQPDVIPGDILETQPLLSHLDQTPEPLCPDKHPIPNNTAKSIQASSLEKPCILSPNAQKSTKCINIEKSSTSCNRPLKSNRPTVSSTPKRLCKSCHLEKTYKKCGLKTSNKLNHTCELANVNSSCSDKRAMPWLSVLQTSAKRTTQSSSIAHNKITPTKPCRIKKPNLSQGHYEVKRSVNRGKPLLPMPTAAKLCRHYKDKCLVCNTSGFLLNDLSRKEKNNEENLYGSVKVKPHLKPFYDTGYKTYQKSVSNDIMKEPESEDSNTEIVFIYDISHDDITNKEPFQY